jgi:hypothetical protein
MRPITIRMNEPLRLHLEFALDTTQRNGSVVPPGAPPAGGPGISRANPWMKESGGADAVPAG